MIWMDYGIDLRLINDEKSNQNIDVYMRVHYVFCKIIVQK